MADLALHHTKTYDIDGYRLDAATYKGPSWDPALPYPAYRSGSAAPELMERMLQAMHTIKPEAVMLSEVFGPVFYTVSNLVHDNQTEGPQLVLEKMDKGEYTARDYKLHMRNVMLALPKGANRVYYTRNHDTSWFYHFNGYTPRFMAMEAIHTLCAIPEIFAGDPRHKPSPDDDKATYAYYQKLFSLRKDFPELAKGELLLEEVDGDNPMVFTAIRSLDGKSSLVAVSLADREETVSVSIASLGGGAGERLSKVNLIDGLTRQPITYEVKGNTLILKLKPYQVLVGRL
jgi:glycosidase